MMAFSYTAPQVSSEEEWLERKALTEIERQQIHCDLYGETMDGDIHETESVRLSAEENMRYALAEIPAEKKEAYLEAMKRVPQLVERESNALAFLRREKYDGILAAQRLVEYWKFRKMLFGEKAFLPMTIDGAMRDDLETVKVGFLSVLPDDKGGRPVLYYDRVRHYKSRITRDIEVRDLCLLHKYMLSTLCDATNSKTLTQKLSFSSHSFVIFFISRNYCRNRNLRNNEELFFWSIVM